MNDSNKNIEIEKKYFVKNIPFDLSKYKYYNIEQTYISVDPTIRLRKTDNEFIFTFKGKGDIQKVEFEYPLNEEQYNRLLNKSETKTIIKQRYVIDIKNGLKAELDIYGGELEGFMNVEVEFSDIDEANSFIPPEWFGEDISLDKRYSNVSLAINGLVDKK